MRDFAYKPQINDDPIGVPTDVESHCAAESGADDGSGADCCSANIDSA